MFKVYVSKAKTMMPNELKFGDFSIEEQTYDDFDESKCISQRPSKLPTIEDTEVDDAGQEVYIET